MSNRAKGTNERSRAPAPQDGGRCRGLDLAALTALPLRIPGRGISRGTTVPLSLGSGTGYPPIMMAYLPDTPGADLTAQVDGLLAAAQSRDLAGIERRLKALFPRTRLGVLDLRTVPPGTVEPVYAEGAAT